MQFFWKLLFHIIIFYLLFASYQNDSLYLLSIVDGDKPVEGSISGQQRLGPTGLALHYANIIIQVDTLVRSFSLFSYPFCMIIVNTCLCFLFWHCSLRLNFLGWFNMECNMTFFVSCSWNISSYAYLKCWNYSEYALHLCLPSHVLFI